jgi:alpha-galactosidase
MKWHKRSHLSFCMSCLLCCTAVHAAEPTEAEMALARRWAEEKFGETPKAEPPFSFHYGGKASGELLPNWQFTRSSRPLDDRRTQRTLTWIDPTTGLEVRSVAVQYRDFPIVEWTLHFKNTGTKGSPILEQIGALDATFGGDSQGEPVLHHFKGTPATPDDYRPRQTPLVADSRLSIGALGGRPSNSDLPYFNLAWSDGGVIVAVGWPGQWTSAWSREPGSSVRVRAGQEITHFTLLPGEEVRTPLVVVQFWKGDRVASHNVWRRWMLEHNVPRPGGQLPPTQFQACSSHQFREMLDASEENQKLFIDRYLAEGLQLDYWWMDAGWYKHNGKWENTGTWEVDSKRFPNGLRAITDHGRSKGVKSIVWFEPERVTQGSWLYENHAEWLLAAPPVDLDNPLAGLGTRRSGELGGDPSVSHNPTSRTRSVLKIQWEPGRLAFHPGSKGEYSVVRWTAPVDGEFSLQGRFIAIDPDNTTEVHVLHDGRSVFKDRINLDGRGTTAVFDQKLKVAKGEPLDFVLGWGNGTHASDSTGLEVTLRGPDARMYDAAKEFRIEQNPNGSWSYGYLKPGLAPDSSTFRRYDQHDVIGDNGWRLLNLGHPPARQWLTEHVDKTIREQGIDLYRQDFNMDPLPYWNAADAKDRQGISEIRYVEGYLAYWDELLRRHPNLLIDSCASGGRRNDLETLRRSVPLLRSDHLFEPTGQQCHMYGISFWYPYHGTGTLAGPSSITPGLAGTVVDPYEFRSHMSPSVTACWDVRRKDLDYASLRKLTSQLIRIQPFYLGDYYPLSDYSTENNVWMAWQFDRPEARQGIVQVFRRPKSGASSQRIRLHGLDPAANYEVTNLDSEQPEQYSGQTLLMDGLPVQLDACPAAAVFVYQRK